MSKTYVFEEKAGIFVDSVQHFELAGYIFNFPNHGAFCPDGKVPATAEQIMRHNQFLADMELKAMQDHGRAILYQYDGNRVGTWTGRHTWPISYSRKGNHNIAGKRLDIWFTGPGGKRWHGVNLGDNDIVRCKRIKS